MQERAIERTLEKIVHDKNNGLFLLDPPTGFGKTTAVVKIIRRFLQGDESFKHIKRIYFVTNLINNLPFDKVLAELTPSEKAACFRAKATIDYVLERFLNTEISNKEIVSSKEYKTLKEQIESYHFTKTKMDASDKGSKSSFARSLKILRQAISTQTEPAFRKFIKTKFLAHKSNNEKKDFIKKNPWLYKLYPIGEIDKYKVIFLTTKKFISPIDTFKRMPFYLYCDDKMMSESVVFFDEFDSTKKEFLDQIIEDGLKTTIDVVSLFLSLHFVLQNLVLPQQILHTSEYHKAKVASQEWYSTQSHFDYWRRRFDEKYKEHNINYLLKSVGFDYKRAFLFDDGKQISVIKDSSKKFIYTLVDEKEKILSLRGLSYNSQEKLIDVVIKDLRYCIDGFTKSLFFVSNNYMYYKNEKKHNEDTKYTLEEAIYTVLDLLNLSEEEKEYLFRKIQTGDYVFEKEYEHNDKRKGFCFTEIEDSDYHDMKSVVHSFIFPSTPEDVIVKLAKKTLTVGISATARVDTCIGNYALDYVKEKLENDFIEADSKDLEAIKQEFSLMKSKYQGKCEIHTVVIDDFDVFSYREKCEEIIKCIFTASNQEKYKKLLSDQNISLYQYFIELKVAYFYKIIGDQNIKSGIAFLNKFPKPNDDLNSERLAEMFRDIDSDCSREPIVHYITNSQDFDEHFEDAKNKLAVGKSVLVITTYQTIGSGKNIQYPIPDGQEGSMFIDPEDIFKNKDFEAVYVSTPTNLSQVLSYESEDKYDDLARFLYQQEYLYKRNYLTYPEMRNNIANGFRKTFFSEKAPLYYKNGDVYLHTLKIAIQAIGRICRCRSKNKDIYVLADRELIWNVQEACKTQCPEMLNDEFMSLLSVKLKSGASQKKICEYSQLSRDAYNEITRKAYTVRKSRENVLEWQFIRDFVLKNPTADFIPDKYRKLYFEFEDKISGFSFKQNNWYVITDLITDLRYYGMKQVSAQECNLPVIMSFDFIKTAFEEQKFACDFKAKKFVMSPSLYKQVYLGALGEVVGKIILEHYLGCDVEELDDFSLYELFDYKIGDVYIDFKNWDRFRTNNNDYVKKVERKLKRVNGKRSIVINLFKQSEAITHENVGETVIQVPYLIDGYTGTINKEALDYICTLI